MGELELNIKYTLRLTGLELKAVLKALRESGHEEALALHDKLADMRKKQVDSFHKAFNTEG